MKKACMKCRILTTGNTCPLCNGTTFSENWKGRVFISNPEKSEVAKKMAITAKGEYAIKLK